MRDQTISRERELRERKFSKVRDQKLLREVLRFLGEIPSSLPFRLMSEERAGHRTDYIFDPEKQDLWKKTGHALELTLPFACRDGTALAYEAKWHIPA